MIVRLVLVSFGGVTIASSGGAAKTPDVLAAGSWCALHNPSSDAGLEACALKEGGPCATHFNVTFYNRTVSAFLSPSGTHITQCATHHADAVVWTWGFCRMCHGGQIPLPVMTCARI